MDMPSSEIYPSKRALRNGVAAMSTRCSNVVGTLCVCLQKAPNEFINLKEPCMASEGAKHFVFHFLGRTACIHMQYSLGCC